MSGRADVVFDRRVQLLIDQDSYARLAAEAKQADLTVNAVIRDAVAAHLAGQDQGRRRAAAAQAVKRRLAKVPDEAPYELDDLAAGHYGGVG